MHKFKVTIFNGKEESQEAYYSFAPSALDAYLDLYCLLADKLKSHFTLEEAEWLPES
jgi:hypothetical protein